jgi:putative nucleotidyltransferase with HDIG domain
MIDPGTATRERNMALLREYTASESLIKHMMSVEAAMRAYARKLGEDEELWGTVGLLHDFDYERYPELTEHTVKGAAILREAGYPEDVIRAIQAHNDHNGLNLQREKAVEKALVACDELCGFITAVTLVKPSKSLADVSAESVIKKMKDKAFARQVNREEIRQGTLEFGFELKEHVSFVIEAMKGEARALGLDGSLVQVNTPDS